MNLAPLDWAILAGMLALLVAVALYTRRYATTVSGFLAAERCAGRYLISVAFNMAQLGVITLVWYFQQNYDVGWTSIWWGLTEGPAMIVIALSGWVIYRFRRTRALTLAQFFEMRYSRRFRVFAGLVAFLSGIVNYGIFPGVAARFFIALCGFPERFECFGQPVRTFTVVMVGLMAMALLFVFLGGQIAVMATDFLQGVFANAVFLLLIGFLLWTIPWSQVEDVVLGRVWMGQYVTGALASAPPAGRSLVNPFDLGGEANFNVWYWLISVVVLFYGMRAWQGDQGYNAAARNAHEARMANILNGWRFRVLMLITIVLPIAIRVVMHHPAWRDQAEAVRRALEPLPTEALRAETRTPLAAAALLPAGLLGLFATAMLGAFLSTNDTYLHSWGSIFVQDVVLPFRRRPLSPRAHLWLLRGAIGGVAIFAVAFSSWYEPNQYIAMFLALTGAVFVGGAGAAIIGGLYWRRGTTAAAWTAMILGLVTSGYGIVVKQTFVRPTLVAGGEAWWSPLAQVSLWIHDNPWVSGQVLTFAAIAISVISYVLVSLLGPGEVHDLDRLLHRGPFEVEEDRVLVQTRHALWLERLGFDPEFTGRDKWVTLITISWPLVWTVIFLVGTAWCLVDPPSDEAWLAWWRGWTWLVFVVGAVIVVWFAIGGSRDLRELFRLLAERRASGLLDARDDGRVEP